MGERKEQNVLEREAAEPATPAAHEEKAMWDRGRF
jgi:hypothetical protein